MRGLEPLPLPRNLVAAAEAEGRTTLPATVARLAGAWSLTVGAPFQPGGQTAWVAPVRNRAGAELVLKVAWAHPEAEHEAAGLRAWVGDGAVRPHAAEESGDTIGLLLERCQPGTPLAELPERRQDVVIAGLVRFGISTVRPSEEVAALVHRMSHRSVGRVVVTRSDGSLVGLFFAEDAPAVDEHKPSLSGDDI
jgi:hypothetical protein